MSADLFQQINNAVLDLQAADLQTYQRPLKRLVYLLGSDQLTEANKLLTAGLDLDAFLDESEGTGGSFIGSHELAWPDNEVQTLGLTWLLLQKMGQDNSLALDISHQYFSSGSTKIMVGVRNMTTQLIIPFVRDYTAYVQRGGHAAPTVAVPSNKVFIVHGHDDAALQGLARFLERLGLEAMVLKELPNQGRTIIEKFEHSAAAVGFAVVLLTPDDLGGALSSDALGARARQNVVFELGYFAGKLGRGRVCLLRKGDIEIPSDLFGVVYTEMDPSDGWKAKLVRELQAAGLQFDANKFWQP